ncbi:ceramide glucosyltransferase-B isoform X2 [Hydra vulgaris]|uniref:ceramide glucosyltransferase n=1 Tax=Hydra vulgaris TaxID=6087 RepID=A0ABM4DFF4_HYDVU
MYIKVLDINITFVGALAWLCIGLWIIVFLVHALALTYGKLYLYSWRKLKDKGNVKDLPAVSIIKTVAGNNSNILSNLETVFLLEYPKFEVLICVQEEKNELIPKIEEMMHDHPNVDSRIFVGAQSIGVNPKINNMIQCYDSIKYEYFWICDSNILLHKESLLEIGYHLKPDVGLVHQLPYVGHNDQSFGSCFEKIHFGTQHARWYLAFYALGIPCVNGMSNIIKKKFLDDVGGLRPFSKYIAEDFFIGMSFSSRQIKILLSTEPAIQSTTGVTVEKFINRMTRWQKLRLTMLASSFFEPFIECFLLGFLASMSLWFLDVASFFVAFVSHVTAWFLLDQLLLLIIEKKYSRLPPFFQRSYAWLLRELYTYRIFYNALFDREIHWNNTTFTLKYGGIAVSSEKKS